MATNFKFVGRVIPASMGLSLRTGAKVSWELDGTGSWVDFEVVIEAAVVTVECTTESAMEEKHIHLIYMRAVDIARATVDLVSFANGYGWVVVLDEMIDAFGTRTSVVPHEPTLPSLCRSYGLDSTRWGEFQQVLAIALQEPPLFMAINDLVAAISLPHHAPINCARAVEAIRHLMAPGIGREEQWPVMREALRVEKTYLDLVMDTSKSGRHGDRSHIPGSVVRESMQRAWTLMDRFFEFKKRGSQPLPQPEFLTLV